MEDAQTEIERSEGEALLERIREGYKELVKSDWFRKAYEGASLGEVIKVEGEGPVVEMTVESREGIPASDHDMLKLRGSMLAEIPIIEAMVDCTCRFQVGDRIAVRFTRIEAY